MPQSQIEKGSQQGTPLRIACVLFEYGWTRWRYKAEGRGFNSPTGLLRFLIDFIPSAALWPVGQLGISTGRVGGGGRGVRMSDNFTILMCLLFRNYASLKSLDPQIYLYSPFEFMTYNFPNIKQNRSVQPLYGSSHINLLAPDFFFLF